MSQESNAHHDRTRDGNAILEVSPPTVDRRSLLVGGGLGIATTVLPSAISAASILTVEPSAAFEYSGASVLLHWTPFDPRPTGDPATYSSVPGDDGIAESDNITGTHGRGGTSTGASDDPRVIGLEPLASSGVPRAPVWGMRSTTNQLTLSGDSASPHLEWTITNGYAEAMTVSTLVIHRLRNTSTGGPAGPLNLAFYVSTSVGFASPVLRRTASIADNTTRHLVVPLASGLSGGVSLEASKTLTVRAFPYSTSTSRDDVRFLRYDATDNPFSGGAAIDTVDTAAIGATTTNGDHICAFIGTPPT